MNRDLQNNTHKASISGRVITLTNKSTKTTIEIQLPKEQIEVFLDVIFNRD